MPTARFHLDPGILGPQLHPSLFSSRCPYCGHPRLPGRHCLCVGLRSGPPAMVHPQSSLQLWRIRSLLPSGCHPEPTHPMRLWHHSSSLHLLILLLETGPVSSSARSPPSLTRRAPVAAVPLVPPSILAPPHPAPRNQPHLKIGPLSLSPVVRPPPPPYNHFTFLPRICNFPFPWVYLACPGLQRQLTVAIGWNSIFQLCFGFVCG
jgi:hypothetical protein